MCDKTVEWRSNQPGLGGIPTISYKLQVGHTQAPGLPTENGFRSGSKVKGGVTEQYATQRHLAESTLSYLDKPKAASEAGRGEGG